MGSYIYIYIYIPNTLIALVGCDNGQDSGMLW